MNMHSSPPENYVLLEGEEHETETPTPATDISHLLVGKTLPTPVSVPAITISQYSNQMLFHHTILTKVDTEMRHALRERNAALAEINRLKDIEEGKTINIIPLHKHLIDGTVFEESESTQSLLKTYAVPVIKTALKKRIEKEEERLRTQEAKYRELRTKAKELRAELFRCKAEISKVEQQVEDSKKEPNNTVYLQMSH
jgi:peptidoglycan hydrolase CwlO-like protein